MSQLPVSGENNNSTFNMVQYRASGMNDFRLDWRPYIVSKPTPSSAVRQMNMTGINTWNTLYDEQSQIMHRMPQQSRHPLFIIEYMKRNPANPNDPVPIPIAEYALNTGLIYVGGNGGNFGGIQVGQQGGPSGY